MTCPKFVLKFIIYDTLYIFHNQVVFSYSVNLQLRLYDIFIALWTQIKIIIRTFALSEFNEWGLLSKKILICILYSFLDSYRLRGTYVKICFDDIRAVAKNTTIIFSIEKIPANFSYNWTYDLFNLKKARHWYT